MRSITRTLVLISIVVLQIQAECKSRLHSPYHYHFLQKVGLVPYQAVYHVGDTIRFGFTDTGKKIFDTASGSFVKADSMGFVIEGSLARLVKSGAAMRIHPDHFFTSSDGSNFVPTATDQEFGVTNFYTRVGACGAGSDLRYSAGIIPRYAGVYELGFVPQYDVYNCYTGVNYGVDISFVFDLDDCNGGLVAGIGPTSVISAADTADYARLAARKITFFFRVE